LAKCIVRFGVLAEDGAAWFQVVKARYPNARKGFIGVSQGGFIAPLAARMVDADFAVAHSASATVLNDQLEAEVANDVRAAGVPVFLRDIVTTLYVVRAKRRQPGFWKANGPFDLTKAWKAWSGPFFIAYGELDEFDNVPVSQSVARLERCCAGSMAIDWNVYRGTGHSLVDPETETFIPDFWRDQIAWILGPVQKNKQ